MEDRKCSDCEHSDRSSSEEPCWSCEKGGIKSEWTPKRNHRPVVSRTEVLLNVAEAHLALGSYITQNVEGVELDKLAQLVARCTLEVACLEDHYEGLCQRSADYVTHTVGLLKAPTEPGGQQ